MCLFPVTLPWLRFLTSLFFQILQCSGVAWGGAQLPQVQNSWGHIALWPYLFSCTGLGALEGQLPPKRAEGFAALGVRWTRFV